MRDGVKLIGKKKIVNKNNGRKVKKGEVKR